nr:PhnD/SsuA/transferrin family substrate-binding protein [uncultured Desulfobacter sp.]
MQIDCPLKPLSFRLWAMALLVVTVCLHAGPAQSIERLNIGFSRSIIGGVNENDALAVIKVWATELIVSENVAVNVHPEIYGDVREIENALKRNQADFICITSTEFFDLQHLLDREKCIFSVNEGRMTEEYLLITRKSSPIAELKDLKSRSLLFTKNARNALSVIWLDVELGRAGLPAAEHFFNRMEPVGKISAALLPIFFGREDACLVTRNGFDIMAELNPQIPNQLKILTASMKYIPDFLVFRKGYQSIIKDIILKEIQTWNQTPAGHQILTIFHTDALIPKPFEILWPTMDLIKEHRRLWGDDTGTIRPDSRAEAATP